MEDQFFARIPYDLFDARRQNIITSLQFDIMVLLHRWANWHTGIVRTCSADRLQRAMGDLQKPPSERTIQRHLQGLHEAGWVYSHYKKGSKKPYPVDINNFMPVADGDAGVTVIRPTTVKDWEETDACRVADEGATGDGEGALKGRCKGGLKETVHETSHKTSHEISSNETSSNEGLSESVSESLASLGSVRTDASHPSKATPVEEAKELESEIRPWSQEEMYVVQSLMVDLFKREANQAILARIQAGDPNFIWTLESKAVVLEVISSGRWLKSLKTPDDFAFRWESHGPTSLGAQVWRNMPDEPAQPVEKAYLEGEIDTDEETPVTETFKECEDRTEFKTIYNGPAVAVVVKAYKEKTPQLQKYADRDLWLYKDEKTKKWGISWNRAILLQKMNGVEQTFVAPETAPGLRGRFGAAMKRFEMQEEMA
jgi:hypothetical protein